MVGMASSRGCCLACSLVFIHSYSFIHIHSFIFIHSFIHSYSIIHIHSFIFIHSYSFIHIHSFIFIHSYSFIHIHSFIHSFIHFFASHLFPPCPCGPPKALWLVDCFYTGQSPDLRESPRQSPKASQGGRREMSGGVVCKSKRSLRRGDSPSPAV